MNTSDLDAPASELQTPLVASKEVVASSSISQVAALGLVFVLTVAAVLLVLYFTGQLDTVAQGAECVVAGGTSMLFTYPSIPEWHLGHDIHPCQPRVANKPAGSGPLQYSVSPRFPTGISLNKLTGIISGKPMSHASSDPSRTQTYTVTARFDSTIANAQVTIRTVSAEHEVSYKMFYAGRRAVVVGKPFQVKADYPNAERDHLSFSFLDGANLIDWLALSPGTDGHLKGTLWGTVAFEGKFSYKCQEQSFGVVVQQDNTSDESSQVINLILDVYASETDLEEDKDTEAKVNVVSSITGKNISTLSLFRDIEAPGESHAFLQTNRVLMGVKFSPDLPAGLTYGIHTGLITGVPTQLDENGTLYTVMAEGEEVTYIKIYIHHPMLDFKYQDIVLSLNPSDLEKTQPNVRVGWPELVEENNEAQQLLLEQHAFFHTTGEFSSTSEMHMDSETGEIFGIPSRAHGPLLFHISATTGFGKNLYQTRPYPVGILTVFNYKLGHAAIKLPEGALDAKACGEIADAAFRAFGPPSMVPELTSQSYLDSIMKGKSFCVYPTIRDIQTANEMLQAAIGYEGGLEYKYPSALIVCAGANDWVPLSIELDSSEGKGLYIKLESNETEVSIPLKFTKDSATPTTYSLCDAQLPRGITIQFDPVFGKVYLECDPCMFQREKELSGVVHFRMCCETSGEASDTIELAFTVAPAVI